MELSGLFTGDERKRKEREMREAGRLPAGQSLTLKWPVLHYGSVPHFDSSKWSFFVRGLVKQPQSLDWTACKALPRVEEQSDFHCVTRWSRFDNHWRGISTRSVLDLASPLPETTHVLVHGEQGYTANLPLADFTADHVLFATHHEGQPLTEEHGGPLRLIVPHLYAWKSVKWVRGIELLDQDVPGFWEQNGYHIHGDPFREQRFSE
ncbi:MAG: sulfite oxidase-like oxidoreductase [Acidobacteriales bacterium]|nr:sulfite oxidase-like oxidoreductase [Terriglobales bacterium]